MACNQTLSGLVRDCSPNIGGIKTVYLANKEDVTSVTATSGKISAITMASSAKMKKYAFAPDSCSLTSTYTFDNAKGVKFVTSELLLQFNRMDTTKRVEISALAVNDLVAVVVDNNDVAWYLGYNNPVNASAGDGQTGAAKADGNRYTITLQDISNEMPMEVDNKVLSGLV